MLYHGIMKPLYIQLRDILVEEIKKGKILPGDSLPSERNLADQYNISRVTVRRCFGKMQEEGYIIKQGGKPAIVANPIKVNHRLGNLVGVAEELEELISPLKIEVIKKGYERVPKDILKHLGLEDNSKVYVFDRLILKDNKPIVVNYSYVSAEIGKIIETLDLKKDKVFTCFENCGFNINYAEQEITADICRCSESEHLNYKIGQPTLVLKRTTFMKNGDPILYEKSVYRADAYQYSIKLVRNKMERI